MSEPEHAPGLLIHIPPPIWFFGTLLLALALDAAFDWNAIFVLRARAIALVLIAGGLGLAIWGRTTFAKAGTEIMPSSSANAKLVTHGPFHYSRNPMYVGVMLLSLGAALFGGTLPYFAATAFLFWLLSQRFIPFEEAKMERQYGQAFRDYKTRVRRWL